MPVPEPKPLSTVWTDIGEILDLPDASYVIAGLLASGSVNLHVRPAQIWQDSIPTWNPESGERRRRVAWLGHPSDAHCGFTVSNLSMGLDLNSRCSISRVMRIMRLALKRHNMAHETTEQFADMILADYLAANPRPSVLCIDTMASFLTIEDSNDYSAVQRGMTPIIQECAQDIGSMDGTATLLTHHDRKSTGNGSDAVLGSRAIAAAVDTLLKLTILKTQGRRRLTMQSRFGIGELGEQIDMDWHVNEGEYRLANDATERDDAVLDAVRAGATTPSKIAAHIEDSDNSEDLSGSVIAKILKRLVNDGLLERGRQRTIQRAVEQDRLEWTEEYHKLRKLERALVQRHGYK